MRLQVRRSFPACRTEVTAEPAETAENSARSLRFLRTLRLTVLVLCLCRVSCLAQTATIGALSYSTPRASAFAPGQIVTLFVSGLKGPLPASASATGMPLPYSLAGVSAFVRQPAASASTLPVPLFLLERVTEHSAAITVQIPFELLPAVTSFPQPYPWPVVTDPFLNATLSIAENGVEGDQATIMILADQVHVAAACDTTVPSALRPPPDTSNGTTTSSSSCPALVFHADGTAVSSAAPARPGETIVIYAYGLGRTEPLVASGRPSPSPATVVASPIITAWYSVASVPSGSIPPSTTGQGVAPTFAGLTPGLVGLYQINIPVPAPPAGVATCTSADSTIRAASNLSLYVRGKTSAGFASLCVQP